MKIRQRKRRTIPLGRSQILMSKIAKGVCLRGLEKIMQKATHAVAIAIWATRLQITSAILEAVTEAMQESQAATNEKSP